MRYKDKYQPIVQKTSMIGIIEPENRRTGEPENRRTE